MDIGFVEDEEKYQQVVADHQVRFYEVVSAFADRNGKEGGAMATTQEPDFDYSTDMRRPPEPGQVRRGPAAREARREVAKSKITIRIDTDMIEQFKQMVPDGQGYQRLMN